MTDIYRSCPDKMEDPVFLCYMSVLFYLKTENELF